MHDDVEHRFVLTDMLTYRVKMFTLVVPAAATEALDTSKVSDLPAISS